MRRLAIHGGPPAVRTAHTVTWPVVDQGLKDAVLAALDTELLGYGPTSASRQFELEFARRHGVRHAVACNSGTNALLLAYFASGLWHSPGEPPPQVIVPAYGFFATVSPLLHLGAEPVFCDVDPELGNIDVAHIESLVTQRTQAIVVVHIAGHPADMPAVLRIARSRGIAVIEDCSHAHGSTLDGRLVGTWGDLAAFSLQTGKLVTGGEGGIVLTNSDEHLVRMSMLGNFRRLEGTELGAPAGLDQTGLGLKFRISPLSAAMAGHHLSRLEELVAARRERLNLMTKLIADQGAGLLIPPTTRPGATRGAFYEYPLRIRKPDPEGRLLAFVRAALAAEGCLLPHSNTKAVHQLPLFNRSLTDSYAAVLSQRPAVCGEGLRRPPAMPNADRLAASVVTLPTFTVAPMELVEQYAEAVGNVASYLSNHEGGKLDVW